MLAGIEHDKAIIADAHTHLIARLTIDKSHQQCSLISIPKTIHCHFMENVQIGPIAKLLSNSKFQTIAYSIIVIKTRQQLPGICNIITVTRFQSKPLFVVEPDFKLRSIIGAELLICAPRILNVFLPL